MGVERSSSQISRAERARHGERLCWRRAGPESARDHRQTGKASARDGPIAARRQIGHHGQGEQSQGSRQRRRLPQPGAGPATRGAQQRSSSWCHHRWPAYSWDGLCDSKGCMAGSQQSSSQARASGQRWGAPGGAGRGSRGRAGLQGVDGLVDGGEIAPVAGAKIAASSQCRQLLHNRASSSSALGSASPAGRAAKVSGSAPTPGYRDGCRLWRRSLALGQGIRIARGIAPVRHQQQGGGAGGVGAGVPAGWLPQGRGAPHQIEIEPWPG